MSISSASTKIKKDIKSKLEKVEGFLNVQDEKEEIYAQLAESLAENKDMEVIISKCEELIRSGIMRGFKQIGDDDALMSIADNMPRESLDLRG